MQLAAVVGVGVEGGDRECGVAAENADALPVERGGDLERNAGERGLAIVADGEEGAHGDLLLGGVEVHVHVEGNEGDGLALGVRGDGGGGYPGLGLRSLRRGVAAFVGGAGKDDLAAGLLFGLGHGLRRWGRKIVALS
jgi:hypothetical protein